MPSSSTHAGPSSLLYPSSPANDPCAPGSDGPEEQVDAGVWKRRYLVLQETVNSQKTSKRKAE